MPNTDLIKGLSMVVMFSITLITGNIPLRVKSFKENQKILALASAFSGGLFLSVGLIHIIPEAAKCFSDYFDSEEKSETSSSANQNSIDVNENQGKEPEEHFPFHMLIAVLSFSLVLLIEKVIGGDNHQHHHHHHHDSDEEVKKHIVTHNHCQGEDIENTKKICQQAQCNNENNNNNYTNIDQQVQIELSDKQQEGQLNTSPLKISPQQSENDNSPSNHDTKQGSDQNIQIKSDIANINSRVEEEQRNQQPKPILPTQNLPNNQSNQIQIQQINSQSNPSIQDDNIEGKKQQSIKQIFNDINFKLDEKDETVLSTVTPYVLQVAFGIHATLEGLAIGVESKFSNCLTIALAVLAHKWAEGMVMGLAMKQAKIKLWRSTIMITLQAVMNPMGIGIGWALSDAGDLTSGILMSISAGTFVYIATNEVISEEFSKNRYLISKFLLYLIGIGFICSLWFVEQATGG